MSSARAVETKERLPRKLGLLISYKRSMVKCEGHNRFSILEVAALYLKNVIYVLVATAIDFICIHCLQVGITTPEGVP